MSTPIRKILVTSALLYANGPLHLGHMVEVVQTDIWVRFQKMRGHQCLYISGNDAHGTPIMISAEKNGVTPEMLIAKIGFEHQADFRDFTIGFDHFYTTHSPENRELVEYIYQKLVARSDIIKKSVRQAYDPVKNMFLPDRYVKGECPSCGAKDQYGDSCEACGSTYLPFDLKNPRSVLSGVAPIERESEHYFFCLDHYEKFLRKWTREGHLQEQVTNKLNEWLKSGLHQWDISRDTPYFGFEIPNAPNKFFYVWLDAPIGYMAIFQNLCAKQPELNFAEFWNNGSDTELYHFVGKDIVYFHALFWPAMLHGSDFRTPTAVFTHGFLTVDGQKMSKSRGTFVKARTYLEHLDAEYLRYYFAAKLTNRIDDIDLNLEDFMQRVNADLIGKVVNIASRCAGFIHKFFAGELAARLAEPKLYHTSITAGDNIANYYESRDYARAIREIMEIADRINQYIDDKKPWVLAKQAEEKLQVQEVCSMGLNLFRILMIYLKPVLPTMAEKVENFLNIPPLRWEDRLQPLLAHTINPFTPLLQRIDITQITALKQAAQTSDLPPPKSHAKL
jgi:methionyl-tRNA synthetase